MTPEPQRRHQDSRPTFPSACRNLLPRDSRDIQITLHYPALECKLLERSSFLYAERTTVVVISDVVLDQIGAPHYQMNRCRFTLELTKPEALPLTWTDTLGSPLPTFTSLCFLKGSLNGISFRLQRTGVFPQLRGLIEIITAHTSFFTIKFE